MPYSKKLITEFRESVFAYYRMHRREMPWREPDTDGRFDPYRIWISEIMLQQTQVSRVVPKFEVFVQRFPDVHSLAAAELADVLRNWLGLGYNRRAKFLWQAACLIVADRNGQLPETLDEWKSLPGVGHNTAAAIMAYAYDAPVVFIETNIRTVFIHHFFHDRHDVSDTELLPIISQALPKSSDSNLGVNREWYWALMDYGTHIKSVAGNASRRSRHYAKQSAFHGSIRQIRGEILRLLASENHDRSSLQSLIQDDRLAAVLSAMTHEGLIRENQGIYSL